jgi:alpha-tubulin suppressor-like RCC1 family protein
MDTAKITYQCPITNDTKTVGPGDYEPRVQRPTPIEPLTHFVIVNCLCGQTHRLALTMP